MQESFAENQKHQRDAKPVVLFTKIR